MSQLRRMFVAGYVIHEDIDRLYHAFIDVSVIVAGFDEGKKMHSRKGICPLVREAPPFYGMPTKPIRTMLEAMFSTWEKHSGNAEYPVPFPQMDPASAYNRMMTMGPRLMWSRLHPYGANRRELLTHCINEVSKLRLEIQNGLEPRINR